MTRRQVLGRQIACELLGAAALLVAVFMLFVIAGMGPGADKVRAGAVMALPWLIIAWLLFHVSALYGRWWRG